MRFKTLFILGYISYNVLAEIATQDELGTLKRV
jgi:hypothetical protein